jgi:hypothetical protein
MQLQRLIDCAVRLAQLMIRLLTVLETMIAMTGNREDARVPRESHYFSKARYLAKQLWFVEWDLNISFIRDRLNRLI